MKNSKLHPPFWKLVLFRLKYQLFSRRPIPWLSQKFCDECKVLYNKDILDECPMCGRGPNVVFVVMWHQQIEKVCRDPKDAVFYRTMIEVQGGGPAEVERWRIQ